MEQGTDDTGEDDSSTAYLTLRVRRSTIAFLLAVGLHVVAGIVVEELEVPVPPLEEKPVAFALQPQTRPPPPPPPPAAPTTSRRPPRRRRVVATPPTPEPPPEPPRDEPAAPPAVSPVAPELPPSPEPPEHRARLPVVELAPEPAPAPETMTWKEKLMAQLKRTQPRRVESLGALAPSAQTLQRVAANDPRMHDEETERRLMIDHGPFFRRGIEALRGNWHPNEALRLTSNDPAQRCGTITRTTFAVAILDKEGYVVDVDLKDTSGCVALDNEAIAAFKRVAHFPRPPPDLFKAPDGTPLETARFPVRFILSFDGQLQLRFR